MERSRRGPHCAPVLRTMGWRCPRLRREDLYKRKGFRATIVHAPMPKIFVCGRPASFNFWQFWHFFENYGHDFILGALDNLL